MNLAANPKTFLERDDWMRAMNASGLPPAVRILAIGIALHVNVKTGQCDPGHACLCKETGISERSINRFFGWLERTGWLAITRRGRGKNNSYVLLRPAKAMADHTADDPPNRAPMTRQTVHYDPPHGGRQKAKNSEKRKERKVIYTPPSGGDVGKRAAEKTESTRGVPSAPGTPAGSQRKSGEINPNLDGALDCVGNSDPAFDEFWAAFPRKCSIGAARRAHARAVARGADPAMLPVLAKRYAIERAALPPDQWKYTKGAERWLIDECWNDEPAGHGGTLVIDQAGNVVGFPQVTEKSYRTTNPRRDRSWDEVAANVARAMFGGNNAQH
jgi:hypothetical protein